MEGGISISFWSGVGFLFLFLEGKTYIHWKFNGEKSLAWGKRQGWTRGIALRKFIALSALDDIVQHEHGAMIAGFKNEHILIFGFLVVQDLIDFERHGLTGPHVGDFAKPAI